MAVVALANSINYNVNKQRLYSPLINIRASFECKESERDKHTTSFIRDVLESDTSFLFIDSLYTILNCLCCY